MTARCRRKEEKHVEGKLAQVEKINRENVGEKCTERTPGTLSFSLCFVVLSTEDYTFFIFSSQSLGTSVAVSTRSLRANILFQIY